MARKVVLFGFEGEQLTIAQIRERVPRLADWSIRNLLAKGINTKVGMLSHRPVVIQSAETKQRIRAYGQKCFSK